MEPHTSAHGRLLSPRRVATEPLPLQSPRRSLSVSSASSSRSVAPSGSSLKTLDESIETLFDHPSVKIIAFTSSQRSSSFGAPDFFAEPKPGSLPASSKLERTLAVDETNSRFILQIRRPQYWRIELPLSTPQDVDRASSLRDVFGSILLFEKTECPFMRNFTVALPERPQTPVKKIPWTAAGKNLVPSVFSSDLSPSLPAITIANEKLRRRTLDTDSQIHREARDQACRDVGHNTSKAQALEPVADIREAPAASDVLKPHTSATQSHHTEGTLGQSTLDDQCSSQLPLSAATARATADGSPTMSAQGASIICPVDSTTVVPPTSGLPCSLPAEPTQPAIKENGLANSVAALNGRHPDTSFSQHRREEMPRGLVSSPRVVSSGSLPANETKPSEAGDELRTSFEAAGSVGAVNLKKKRMSRILAGRSVTMPPRLTVVTTPPPPQLSRATTTTEEAPATFCSPVGKSSGAVPEDQSPDGSVDSFHSVQSWHSPISPPSFSPPSSSHSPASFPYPHDGIRIPRRGSQGTSSAEITPATDATFVAVPNNARNHDPLASPFGADDGKGASRGLLQAPGGTTASSTAMPRRPGVHHRPRTADPSVGRRAFASLPASGNILSPTVRYRPEGPLAVVRRLPSVILHKTVEILLSPPSHLVNLMLQVAAKIAAGEWRGLVLGTGEGGESIPVHWDYSDGELSAWEDDDDYSFSIGRLPTSRRSSGVAPEDVPSPCNVPTILAEDSRSWEVD
ncbi:hypothetical protein KJ359_011184 [Pestalotiopsis sp. 9143b]|nr:hypothetical protein KJ359_011184 [Pestalotiopsis sp. 9143b]